MHRLQLVLLSALALLSTGCEPRDEASTRTPVAAGYPRTVELGSGATFSVPDRPKRIVCATTTAVDYALSLVEPNRIAAVCSQAFQSSLLTLRVVDEPSLRDRFDQFDRFVVESALRSDPDLILCSAFSNPSTVETLRRTRIPLLQLVEPATIDGCFGHLKALGRVLDVSARAEDLVSDLRRRIDALEAENPGGGRTAMFFSGSGVEGWGSGRGTLQHDALGRLGLVNAIADQVGPCAIHLEDLLQADPDFLIIPRSPDGSPSLTREGLNDERLRGLKAIPDHVLEIDDALFQTTSHRVVEACEEIARGLR
ncbi:MAG: ABC transporter substrate-binding protein [Planctomycetota bacterium]